MAQIKYKHLLMTEQQVRDYFEDEECYIENNIIKDARVVVTGHFNGAVSLDITCENICVLSAYNSTRNIGFIIQILAEFLNVIEDNSVGLEKFSGLPIRLVTTGWGGRCIGIGHFMKDKFILIEDLVKVGLDK